jgi:hypothetical protein
LQTIIVKKTIHPRNSFCAIPQHRRTSGDRLNTVSNNPNIQDHQLTYTVVTLNGLLVSVLATGPKIHGPNLAEDDGFVRVTKIHIMTSFGWKVKVSVPCRKILRDVKEPYE